jgi:hypothetical protein
MSLGRSKKVTDCQLSKELPMRSELIFDAFIYESNRYLLCRLVAKGTRKLHRPNTRVEDTTNEMLERLSEPASTSNAMVIGRVPAERRAA